jgi:hypothetical protein
MRLSTQPNHNTKIRRKRSMSSSAYDQWTRLNRQERAYLITHPHHVTRIRNSRDKAFRETDARFSRNGHNDRSDAFRHCFWSSLLARDIGFDNALTFTTAHESHSSNPPNERSMDLHNNSIGLSLGRQGGSDAELSQRCFDALQGGRLVESP